MMILFITETLSLVFPVTILGSVVYFLLKCLLASPQGFRDCMTVLRRIDTLDAKLIELDFTSIISTQTKQDPKFTFTQNFQGFHNKTGEDTTGSAVWMGSVSLACYLISPNLLTSVDQKFSKEPSHLQTKMNPDHCSPIYSNNPKLASLRDLKSLFPSLKNKTVRLLLCLTNHSFHLPICFIFLYFISFSILCI